MAEYSSNLLINPYADEPITTGWTATENAEVISGGYLGSAFRINSPGYLEQTIPVELFGEGTKGIKLSCRVRFINNALPIYAKIVVYLRLQITTADGIVTLFMPCQATIMPGTSGWILFEKLFDEPLREITAASFRVYSVDENVAVDLDNISVALDITATEAEQALNDAISYNDLSLEEHLNDITNSHLSDEQKLGLTGGAQFLRTIKLGLETDIRIANHNLYGETPSVALEIMREKAPVITPLYWTEVLVKTEPNVTASSVAVQRDETGIGRVYVAYITDGKLCVRSAQFAYPVSDMLWEDEAEITDCSKCALDFDGHFVTGTNKKIEYYTDELPWLFYVTSTGQLMAGILGGPYEALVGANVTSVDSIRGVANFSKDIDQGLLVFYVINGGIYYKEYLQGNWGDQETVTIAPANAVKIRVGRTFDWRIVLQVADNLGDLHEVFSRAYVSGNTNLEYLKAKTTSVSVDVMEIGYYDYQSDPNEYVGVRPFDMSVLWMSSIQPVMYDAYNFPVEDEYGVYEEDWGYWVALRWDTPVFELENNLSNIKMTDDLGMIWVAQEIVVDEQYANRIMIRFLNFNNAVNPLVISYDEGTLTSGIILVDPTSVQFNAEGLVPYYVDPPVFVSMWNTDNRTVFIEFDKPIISIDQQAGFDMYGYEPQFSPLGLLTKIYYDVDEVTLTENNHIIKVSLTYNGRLRHPQGNVVLEFSGSLIGVGNSFVLPFVEDFLPVVEPIWFNPHDPEYITGAVPLINLAVKEVVYESYQLNEPNDIVTFKATQIGVAVIHVGTLPL